MRFKFWIWASVVAQLLTATFHSLSFFVKPTPQNDTEKQLFDLVDNYKPDAGMGFHPSFSELFTGLSISFTLICLFGGLLNWFLAKRNPGAEIWKGMLLIETIIFGALFLAMLFFTFFPPILCTGLIFVFLLGGRLSLSWQNKQ